MAGIAAWRLVPCPTCGVAEHKNCRSVKDRNRRVRTPHTERWRTTWRRDERASVTPVEQSLQQEGQ